MTTNKDTCEQKNSTMASLKKDLLLGAAIIICCIISLIVYASLRTKNNSQEEIYYINLLSPEYNENMDYILNASTEAPPDFSKIKGGLFGAHIPIYNEKQFSWFTKRLKQEFRGASGSFLYHMIVVGGMNAIEIDEPLLKASKGFGVHINSNWEVVIVAPTTISAETKEILEKRGFKIRLINPPSQNHLR